MTIGDLWMIGAVLVSPLIAVQVTQWLNIRRERMGRKLDVFKTLMATRSYGTSWDHVGALNRIDLWD